MTTPEDMLFVAQSYTEGEHLTRPYNVLLTNACTSEEANTKHVGFAGELAILHKWKNNLPQQENKITQYVGSPNH